MKPKQPGNERLVPTTTLRKLAMSALAQVEATRRAVSADREAWADLCAVPGLNKRWLRAFVSSQIKQPPAAKFNAIVACLFERRSSSR